MITRRLAVALALFAGLMLNHGLAVAQDGLPNLAWLDPPRVAPDVAYLVEGGELQSLDSFRGKVVVLNFWATWCPPCVAEMPYLDELAGTHGGDHLAVVTMAMERASEIKILEFYERIGAQHLGIYRDPDMNLARSMRVFGLPTTLLIDYEGNIVAQLVGEADWSSDAALADILPLVEDARQASSDVVEQAALSD
jgi:thiol-disulfide isomerase/thioredoxin